MSDSKAVATGTTRRALSASINSSFVAAAFGIPLSLFVVPISLNVAGLGAFGTYSTLSAVLSLIGLGEAGVTAEVTRRVARAAGAGDQASVARAVREGATLLGLMGAAISSVGILLSPLLVSFAFPRLRGDARREVLLVLIGILLQLAVGLMLSGYFAVLTGLQRTDYGNYLGLAGRLLGVLLLVAFASLGWGLSAFFFSNLVITLLGWAGSYWAVLRVRPGFHIGFVRPRWASLSPYFAITFVVLSASISNVFDFQFDKIVLAHFDGAGSAGIYQIGTTLTLAGRSVALAPIGLLLAGAAELLARDKTKLCRLESLMTRGTYSLGALLMLGTAALAPAFIPLWLGPTYDQAVVATQLLSIALMFNLWSAPWYFYALGRGWLAVTGWSSLMNAVTNAISSYFLTRELGLHGALFGSMIGNMAGFLTFWLLLRRLEGRPWLTPIIRPTSVVGLSSLVFFVLVKQVPVGWAGLVTISALYLATTVSLLQLAGALPIRFDFGGRRPWLHLSVLEVASGPPF